MTSRKVYCFIAKISCIAKIFIYFIEAYIDITCTPASAIIFFQY